MRPLHPRIYTHLVTLWLALSAGGIVLGIVVWKRLNESLDASLRGAAFRIAVQGASRTLAEAEAAAHAYYITGHDENRRGFRSSQEQFDRRFTELTELGMPHAELRPDVMELRTLSALFFNTLEEEISARDNGDATQKARDSSASERRELNVKLRSTIQRLESYPEGLLATHSDAARSELQRALSTTLAAGLFGLGAGVLAFYLSRVALRQETQKRELTEHALRAERAAQDKSTFLANMSHEIRTPMNAILGFSELLMAELPVRTRGRQHARSIRDAAQSLLQLINDILDLSKIEASMLELHVEPCDVRELKSFLQTVFSQQATRKGLRLEFFVEPDIPHALIVDRSRLRQVLVNLVGNAIKFTERGTVTVRLLWEMNTETRSSGTLLFEVVDTGVGIPPEKQAQIFEPFVQVDTRRPFEQQGTGLGLSIVQRLIERMGGVIEVASEVGVGSTFRVRLRDVSISARLPASADPAEEPSVDFNDLASAELLVVDDNAVNRQLLQSTFDGTHHRLRFATNGREAVESVRVRAPDVVLMDIRMPEMDGQTALAEIRKIPGLELLPVIAVTASSMVEDEQRLRGAFAGYLRKPFTRSMLFRELAYFIPRQPIGTSSSQPLHAGDKSAPSTHAATRERWPAMLQSLRRIEQTTYPDVRDGGAVSEVRLFATELRKLGESGGCPQLIIYSHALLRDADSYSAQKIEENLARFPALLREIADDAVRTTETAGTAARA